MSDENGVRITVTVDAATAAKIDELAQRMQASQSRMASWLLESGLEHDEWIVRLVTSKVMKGLKNALGRGKRPDAARTRVAVD